MYGYRGRASELLKEAGVKPGDRVKVEKNGRVYEGIVMPRSELGDDQHLVLKLPNGYNIGISIDGIRIKKLEEGTLTRPPPPSLPTLRQDESKPLVAILGTGGTIASRVDYRTGAVFPAFTPEEICTSVPELVEIARIKVVEVCNVFSEHMTPDLWIKIAEEVAKQINEGAKGVVVAHGTDTMGYTAAALSFMLQNLFRPVMLTGAQRSSDRPSSDSALNLISAVAAATSDIAEVCVVMHGSVSDDFCLIHRGVRVRKCHTSRRDAFISVNDFPIGRVRGAKVELLRSDYRKASPEGRVWVDSRLDPRVALVKVYPGMGPEIVESLIDNKYHGIVLEGTGLGHVPQSLFPALKKAAEEGVSLVMTSQCLWGRVDMKVYSTGRDLLQLGVIPAEDMLPEVAYVKLMWVLGRTRKPEEVRELMRKNLAGEISEKTRVDSFAATFT
ncbi:MAG: Glu-tRNA(Gln) amidotransferase subunit GatD [Candidatus Hadarchaeales archaeon]